MMRVFLASWLMLLLTIVACGNEVFSQANNAFEAGRFEEAAKGYEKLLNDGPRVSVLNNLGSAYFRQGDFGRSILAFERALLLSPGDPDLKANLELAQEQAAVFPEDHLKGWRGVLAGVSGNTLAVIALVAAMVLPIVAFLQLKFRGRARWLTLLIVLDLVVLRVALRPMKDQVDDSSRGIVLAKPAKVRLSPFEKAEEKGTLSSGREVKLGEMKSGYFWIDGSVGATQGWVKEDEVARLIPSEATND